MAAAADQTVNATYFKSITSSVNDDCDQIETDFHLYMHQNYAGPNQNQVVVVSSSAKTGFGMVVINDFAITECRDPASKLVARAQGTHMAVGQIIERWYASFNIMFEDGSFKGSTLEIRGAWDTPLPLNWAVLGGTGQFTEAQGVLYGTKLSEDGNGRVYELTIRVLYRPIN